MANQHFRSLRRACLAVVLMFSGPLVADDDTNTDPTTTDEPAGAATSGSGAAAGAVTETQDIPLDDIRVLVEIFHKIKNDYVESITDEKLLENAMRGLLAGLDPHSTYLDKQAYQGLQEGTTGEFGGLGIEVGVEDGFVKVIAPIDDTPAQRAGVQAGDLIIRLDDTPVKGIGLNEAVKRMRGKPGSPIELTIVREGEEKPLQITIIRDVIKIKSVKSRFLEPGYLYLRVSHFQSRTSEDFQAQIRQRMSENAGPLQGIILDLRNNPGGILGAAVAVSDAFLESGKIVYTEGRVEDSQLEFNAKPPDLTNGVPLVVLINEGSASASEIVAGALQDRQRAVIMGRKSFGKGSVQTIFPMNNEAALKLTTARYFTPSGRSIQAEGISPDITIDKVKLSSIQISEANIVTEANLDRHLKQSIEPGAAPSTGAPELDAAAALKSQKNQRKSLATDDFELYEALNLLKGMALVRSRGETE